jgi:hypothetical protein
MKKPPLVVLSNQLWIEQRVADVWAAICRRLESDMEPLPAWIAELQHHIPRLRCDITVYRWKEDGFDMIEKYIFPDKPDKKDIQMKYLLTGYDDPCLVDELAPNDMNVVDNGGNLTIINMQDMTQYCGKKADGSDYWEKIDVNPPLTKTRKQTFK